MTEPFPWRPERILREFLFESLEEQSNGPSWKGGFRALKTGLQYFKTQLLKLVESFMEFSMDVLV